MKIYQGRVVYEVVSAGAVETLNEPEKVTSYLSDVFNEYPMQEQFIVLPLNCRNRPLGRFVITVGLVSSTLVHPREVFRPAILAGAYSIILSHNHPSGDPCPSSNDINLTKSLRQAGEILKIQVLDHVIVGNPEDDPNGQGFYSFAENGLV